MINRSNLEKILNKTVRTPKESTLAYIDYFIKRYNANDGDKYVPTVEELVYLADTDEGEHFRELMGLSKELVSQKLLDEVPQNQLVKGIEGLDAYEMYTYFVKQFLLNNGFCIGVRVDNTQKTDDTYENLSIYTNNIYLINELYNAGAINHTGARDFSSVLKTLSGKIKGGFTHKNGVHLGLARLDLTEAFAGDNTKEEMFEFKLVLPQYISANDETFKLYPYTIFPQMSNQIVKKLSGNIFEITHDKDRVLGLKSRKVTTSRKIEEAIYSNTNDKGLVEGMIDSIKLGWDISRLTCRVYNLEASIYTTGYTRIDFYDIINIKKIQLKDIDTARHELDMEDVLTLAVNRIDKIPVEEIHRIIETDEYYHIDGINIEDMVEKELKDFLKREIYKSDSYHVYEMMKRNPDLFGRVDVVLNNMKDKTAKLYTEFQPVELTGGVGDRQMLYNLLRSGVLRIRRHTKQNTGSTLVYATLNKDILKMVYGENYLETNGTERDRLTILQDELRQGLMKKDDETIIERVKQLRLDRKFITEEGVNKTELVNLMTDVEGSDGAPQKEEKPETLDNLYFWEIKNTVENEEVFRSAKISRITSVEYADKKN